MIDRDPVARLVHELRTPLAVVSGFAELLERRGETLTPEQHAEYLARIIEGVREMDQILDRSRE
jgi:signal transduction histidine kinase